LEVGETAGLETCATKTEMSPVKNSIAWLTFCLLATPLLGRGTDKAPQVGPTPTKARVVMVENTNATSAFETQSAIVQDMLDRAMMKLAAKENLGQAWRTIVATQDVVGIKVYSEPGPLIGTRPAVVEAVVRGLLAAGLPPHNVIIWDRKLKDLRLAGFEDLAQQYDVRLAGSANGGYDEKVFYDNAVMGELTAGDLEFDTTRAKSGRKSYVSKLVSTGMTKIIIVTPLLNHNLAGVTGHLYSLALGSVDNVRRFENDPERMATAVPEIYALPALSDHVVLSITDALIGQYQGENTALLHYSRAMNQLWVSKDAVALDALAIQELERERQARQLMPGNPNLELYRNATLLELGTSDLGKIDIEWAK
jgi:hypothetical protein